MPTNFQISYQPTLRYVTAEPSFALAGSSVAGFTRWRHVERLVIHTGPEVAVKLPVKTDTAPASLLGLRGVFPR